MISSKSAANYFIKLSEYQVNSSKIQKLIYLAHGWHLAIKGEPLLDEYVGICEHGIVLHSIYNEFIEYGMQNIKRIAYETHYTGLFREVVDPPEDAFVVKLLDRIWQTHGHFTWIQLSKLCRLEGSPWHQVFKDEMDSRGCVRKGAIIPDQVIKTYFIKSKERNTSYKETDFYKDTEKLIELLKTMYEEAKSLL